MRQFVLLIDFVRSKHTFHLLMKVGSLLTGCEGDRPIHAAYKSESAVFKGWNADHSRSNRVSLRLLNACTFSALSFVPRLASSPYNRFRSTLSNRRRFAGRVEFRSGIAVRCEFLAEELKPFQLFRSMWSKTAEKWHLLLITILLDTSLVNLNSLVARQNSALTLRSDLFWLFVQWIKIIYFSFSFSKVNFFWDMSADVRPRMQPKKGKKL